MPSNKIIQIDNSLYNFDTWCFFILDHDVQNIKHCFLDLLQIKIAPSGREFYLKAYSIYIPVMYILR